MAPNTAFEYTQRLHQRADRVHTNALQSRVPQTPIGDALLAAHAVYAFHTVAQIAHDHDLLLCAVCFRELRLAGFTLHEQTNVGGFILCNDCYSYAVGETLRERELRLLRSIGKKNTVSVANA